MAKRRAIAGIALATILLAACAPLARAAQAAAGAAPAIAQTHVKTFGFIGAEHSARNAATYQFGIEPSYAQAAAWMTWAATDDRFARAIHAAGMKTAFYVDPHRISANGFPMIHAVPTDEHAYYHNCDGSRVQTSFNGSLEQNVGDPAAPALQTFFNDYIDARQRTTGGSYDAVWEDDAGPLSEFYQPFRAPLPGCWYPGDARYDDAQRAFDLHAHLPVIFENLANHHGATLSRAVPLVGAPNVIAGVLEFCFANGYEGHDARAKEAGTIWEVEENTALAVLGEHRMFLCYDYPGSSASPAAIDQRGYIAASFLLTFDPEESVLAEAVDTPSGVPVEPEMEIVPLEPVVPTPASIDALRTPSGAYAREYRACYIAGKLAGGCAVVVNANAVVPVRFPFRGYTRTIQLRGRGVIAGVDDGTLAFGGAPADLVPPRGWVIALHERQANAFVDGSIFMHVGRAASP